MKKNICFVFFLVISFFTITLVKADDRNQSEYNTYKSKIKFTNETNRDKLSKDYDLYKKYYDVKVNKVLDFYIDFQLGYGSTQAMIEESANVSGEYESESKGGITVGALMYFSLFDFITFSTGIDYTGKNFEVTPPSLTSGVTTIDTSTSTISNHYLNIPVNFNIGGMISKKVGLMFNGGPYFGFLLGTDEEAGLGMKNIDVGLNGTLTANYLITPFLSVILGTEMQYGGLNNLGKTSTVDKLHTLNYSFFSGLRVGLGL